MRRLLAAAALVALGAGPLDGEALADKARAFRDALIERHLSPEGIVLYRIDLQTAAEDIPAGRYPNLADAPTFTGLYAATCCVRAAIVTGVEREEALRDAERALDGLRFLMDVTGERGLLARSVRRGVPVQEPSSSHRRWYRGSGRFSGWQWRGDVSVDQYANGLLTAAAECRFAFPERARRLVVDAAEHLLANDLRLVDPDGRRTRYGDLSWRSGAGFNSIAQLTAYGIFSLAAALDPDPRFGEMRDRLRDRYRVPARARTTNLRVAGITNHSNDLMAWNLYRALVPLARSGHDPALADLRHGVVRAWLRVRHDGNAYFAAVHCRVDPTRCDPSSLAEGVALLQRFPLDKRKRALPPELATIPRALLPGRKWKRLAREPVPMELRPASSLEWKSSPYRVTGGTAIETEYTGVDYLAAYWLYRALGVIAPGSELAAGSAPDSDSGLGDATDRGARYRE